jgi:methylated-DNA-[protein]-cysteine S-methyltransferase
MDIEPQCFIFLTEWGWTGLLVSQAGVKRLVLPLPSPEAVRRQLGWREDLPADRTAIDLVSRLTAYFQGVKVNFPDDLDWSGATGFQRTVWAAARHVRYGETVSYGRLAADIGHPGAARAVGQALARNPVPVMVPCHRIIGRQGRIGGFSGGVPLKRRLLELEGGGLCNSR